MVCRNSQSLNQIAKYESVSTWSRLRKPSITKFTHAFCRWESCEARKQQNILQTWCQWCVLSDTPWWRVPTANNLLDAIWTILLQQTSISHKLCTRNFPENFIQNPWGPRRQNLPNGWYCCSWHWSISAWQTLESCSSPLAGGWTNPQWQVWIFEIIHQIPGPHHWWFWASCWPSRDQCHHPIPGTLWCHWIATVYGNGKPSLQVRPQISWPQWAPSLALAQRQLLSVGRASTCFSAN